MLELLILFLAGLLMLLFGPRAAVLLLAPLLFFTVAGVETDMQAEPLEPVQSMSQLVVIESAHVNVTPDGLVELYVTGTIPDGCEFPITLSMGQSGNTIDVLIERYGPADVDCPAVIVPYEDMIMLDFAFLPGTYAVTVNGLYLEFVLPDPDAPVSPDTFPDPVSTPLPPVGSRSDAVVENVEVMVLESYPMQLVLYVTGYHIDGCELPVYIEQQRDGNVVDVDIFRVMVSRMPCPAVLPPFDLTIPLEGGFESGTYTIIVNEYVLTLEL